MFKSRKNKSTDIKHDSIKESRIHIPQKDAIAIVPPKKVIKALYDYNAPTDPPHYLSFSQGDFLHVVARENDEDWYEACNPLQGTRGLVPVKYFDTVGKTTRDSRDSTHSAPHDSGYAESTGPKSATPNGAVQGHRFSKSLGKLGGAMVYGIVAYDFHAERADELEAKEGEAIIVIAQSNPEWFVAKPITRLGGPGLIPVSFIEIKDMTTGKTVTDPSEAIAKAGIPKVEEWKKMAADYKNTSIPLGSFTTGSHSPSASVSGMTQSMNRMSLNNPQNGHSRSPSQYQPGMPSPPQSTMVSPVRASVPRFIYNEEKFHFIIECSMSNGSHWDLSRIYEDFYELQINLIKAFPDEAGQTGHPRTLPYMPGPVQFVTDKISEGRRENLDEYLQHLLKLGPRITKCALVCNFFQPRPLDYEVDPSEAEGPGSGHASVGRGTPVIQQNPRLSQASQRSQQQYSPSQGFQTTQHQRQLSSAPGPRAPPGHYRNQSDFSQTSGSHPPLMQRQATAASAASSTNAATGVSGAGTGPALKVKVWFDRETCVVVRMPPKGNFQFADLYRKIVERRKLEFNPKKDSGQEDNGGSDGAAGEPLLEIEYRDERDGEYYKLADDEELGTALETNEKLTLVVREVAQ
ncbi:Protein scd2/ral3 [Sphaceloma murrayae]|uniref:Protein scd2/ral3 n=1 Tax=Sphaceloma murrayae TaxID=2082308 RepID=A0A2K1QMI0_9PEZI|nr:Protein scd2/ral3 [Sphaceloma murrayae]